MKSRLVCCDVHLITKWLCLGFVGLSYLVLYAQQPTELIYRLSFPTPQHRWLAVSVEFSDLTNDPLHVRMSNRHWPPRANLLLKKRDHTTAASQNISESHRDEASFA